MGSSPGELGDTQVVPVEALRALATLQRLTVEAGEQPDSKSLIFFILHRTTRFCPYDRAHLWDLGPARPRLLGVSGLDEPPTHTPWVEAWQGLAERLRGRTEAFVLDAEPPGVPALDTAWAAVRDLVPDLHLAWIPIQVNQTTVAALALERWNGTGWKEQERRTLPSLGRAYGVAWRAVGEAAKRPKASTGHGRRAWWIAAGLTAAALAFVIRVPLRIVAPCEVIATTPRAITAPLDGVIESLRVEPGEEVATDAVLAAYDPRVALEDLRVATRRLAETEADLRRLQVRALDDVGARRRMAILTNRRAQDRIRLESAQERVERLRVRAPVAGTVVVEDPEAWRGRPVQLGERILTLIDPSRTRLRIWLPQSDNIPFASNAPARIILGADPVGARPARLTYVAVQSQRGPDGLSGFPCEADWEDGAPAVKVGLTGTAILRGKRVSLAYFLLRKPLLWLRAAVGV